MEGSIIFSDMMVEKIFEKRNTEMNTKCFIPSVKNGIYNGVWYNCSAGNEKIRIIY